MANIEVAMRSYWWRAADGCLSQVPALRVFVWWQAKCSLVRRRIGGWSQAASWRVVPSRSHFLLDAYVATEILGSQILVSA